MCQKKGQLLNHSVHLSDISCAFFRKSKICMNYFTYEITFSELLINTKLSEQWSLCINYYNSCT